MKKLLLTILGTVAMVFSTSAQQNVNIPDANFKTYLLGNMLINTDNDPLEISVVEANTFTGAINCSNMNISDLTGIEAFINLTTLYVYSNQLTSINISNNVNLVNFACDDNQLISLDISNNLHLENLTSGYNQLTSLDVTNNSKLKFLGCNNNQIASLNTSNNLLMNTLNCGYNQITSLDISNNVELVEIYCNNNDLVNLNTLSNLKLKKIYCIGNRITNLNTSSNIDLIWLYCSDNQLTSLNILNNIKLKYLSFENNQLTGLDTSNNIMLLWMYCKVNQLASLDLSNNINLVQFSAFNNQLAYLNVKNGNNLSIQTFSISDNPNLTCVLVDDDIYSTANWGSKDPQTNYSLNCNNIPCLVTIPDSNFKSYLVNNTAINTNGDTEIQCSEAIAFTGIINCSNKNISDLTGIEAFVNVTRLDCSKNQLTNLDISMNISLVNLNCMDNQLSNINLFTNTLLRFLNCSKNQLTSLDVSVNTALVNLNCHLNQLTNLNVSANTVLTNLNCHSNLLVSMDTLSNLALGSLNCSNNQIVNLDMSNNTVLRYFRGQKNALKNLNIANGNNSNVYSFDIRNNINLACVQVDPSTIGSISNIWGNKDVQTYYSIGTCPVIPIAVPVQLRVFKDVSVYPNPTKEIFHIETEGTEVSKIEVLDFSGRVLKEEVNVKNGIDISSLKAGIYSIKIYARGSFITKQLMKE